MPVRTITVTEDAYRRLRANKGESESFSDVLIRLTQHRPLMDFAGVLSHDTAQAVRAALADDRARRRKLDG